MLYSQKLLICRQINKKKHTHNMKIYENTCTKQIHRSEKKLMKEGKKEKESL